MSGTVVFDSIDDPEDTAGGLNDFTFGQSFTTGASPSDLSDVQLLLEDITPSDDGTVAVSLWSDNGSGPDSELASLAVIDDTSLSTGFGTIDVPVSDVAALSASTRYWIEVAGDINSNAEWGLTTSTTGAEVTTESLDVGGAVVPDSTEGEAFQMSVTTEAAACYAAGTRILTARGEIPVESLRAGDCVVTACEGGRLAPVRWVGRRRLAPARHPRPWDVNPVRVRAGAIGPGQPSRDLLLSPDHALFIGGILIRARDLLNGATVVQEQVTEITYYHLELDRHDVMLAEGQPAESFLDAGNRAAFENGGVAAMAHPDFSRAVWARDACAPLVWQGAKLQAARQDLTARAVRIGWTLTEQPDLHLLAGGRRISPLREAGSLVFHLSAGTETVCLRSRTTVPAYLLANNSDTRVLGVAVTGLVRDGVALRLDSAALGDGWLPPEAGLRWTCGAAVLCVDGARRLELHTAGLLRYWVTPERANAVPDQFAA